MISNVINQNVSFLQVSLPLHHLDIITYNNVGNVSIN